MPTVRYLEGEERDAAIKQTFAYFKRRKASIKARGGKSSEGVVRSDTGKPRSIDVAD